METLNEDYDYVRAIAYADASNVLFSAADNGIVRRWDLTKPSMQTTLYKSESVLPTTLSCSQGGNILAVGCTDEKIRIMDFRMRSEGNNGELLLEDEHTDMIKKVQLSPDGMVCFSAGSDCTFKVWDVGTHKCI